MGLGIEHAKSNKQVSTAASFSCELVQAVVHRMGAISFQFFKLWLCTQTSIRHVTIIMRMVNSLLKAGVPIGLRLINGNNFDTMLSKKKME